MFLPINQKCQVTSKLKYVQVVERAVSDTPGNVSLYSDEVDGSSPSFIFLEESMRKMLRQT